MGYICNECELEFEHPAQAQEEIGEAWGQPAYQTVYCCPCCGSYDFEYIEEEE